MRELTSVENEEDARRLVACLSVEGIECEWEVDGGRSTIWIINDDDRTAANVILDEFRKNPADVRFEKAERKVRHVLKEADRLTEQQDRRRHRLRMRQSGSWWYCYPATYILIGLCIAVSVICTDWLALEWGAMTPQLCNREDSALRRQLMIAPPVRVEVDEDGKEVPLYRVPPKYDGDIQNWKQFSSRTKLKLEVMWDSLSRGLKKGEVWRLVGPAFIHMSVLHILFNMMWLYNCGTAIEFVRGTPRFLVLCTILAIISNVAQLFWSGPFFGGMSGVVFGLIGFVWMKGRTQPQLGLAMPQQTLVFCIGWLVLCMTGALGPIANAAHVSGFVVGILIGARQFLWRQLPFVK